MNNQPKVTVRELGGEPSEISALQGVLEATPDYAQRVTGYPPGSADAQSTFIALPDGKSYDDKFVYGIYLDDEMVGCADVIRGYPSEETTLIGLFLISERYQRQGIGKLAYSSLESIIRVWHGIKNIRIGVVLTNDIVLPFWKSLGFVETGEIKPYRYDKLESEALILEKIISL
jgi:ribosomal protein S18 acetylase RimI-like enzyme